MICGAPGHESGATGSGDNAAFAAMVEDDVADLYDNAPCGYLSTLLDGRIAKINATLLGWLGYERDDLVGRRSFTDLLTVGGKLYHETHYAPLLRMQGQVREIALEMVSATNERLPVLVTAAVKTAEDGTPLLIRVTVFDARQRRAYERELLRAQREADQLREEAERQREATERERARLQRLSETLQRTLLPPVLPSVPGVDLACHYHTASTDHVGGDFYDVFALGPGTWGFFLGDVCGKGAEAASLTSLARYTLRAAGHEHPDDPIAVLRSLNATLLREPTLDGRFCTVLYGTIIPHRDGATIQLAGGGHPPALHLVPGPAAADEVRTRPVALPGATLVGVMPNARFTTTTVDLAPGETLLLYTDGLIEPRDADGRLLDTDASAIVRATGARSATASAVVDGVVTFISSPAVTLADDVALLALGVPRAERTESG